MVTSKHSCSVATKPPSTRASHNNCCVQDINTRNTLHSDSNTSRSILGVKIQLYVVHKITINAKSILAQTEGTGTVFLQHFTDFQSKIFEHTNRHGFQTHSFWNFPSILQYDMLIPFTMNHECVTQYHRKAAHL